MADETETAPTRPLLMQRYRIDGTLGQGAHGTVLRAFDTRLQRLVVIKSLTPSATSPYSPHRQNLEERFEREALAASRLGGNPHVISVYDFVTDTDGTRYLILQFAEGGTLAERQEQGAITLSAALRWTADVARGLHAAHTHGLVHRDVKPSNIFLAADGRALIGDFGIAQLDRLSGRTHLTTGHPGTPLYMSPEQGHTTGYVTPASDQYTLGLVLFEMLTGVAYKRVPGQVESHLRQMSLPVQAVIRRMVEETPERRYPTLAEVAQACAEAARTAVGEVGVLRPFVGHTQDVYSIAFSPDGTLLASGSKDESIRVWRTRDATPVWAWHIQVPVTGVAFSPDGRLLASGGGDALVRLWQVGDGALLRSFAGHTHPVLSVAFVPGGQFLVSGSYDTTVRLWRVLDGSLLHTLAGHQRSVRSVACAPDGQTIVSGSEDRTVRLWRVGDAGPLMTLVGHTHIVHSVAVSPDGQLVASASEDGTVRLWRLWDGGLVRIITVGSPVASVAFSPDGQLLASGGQDSTARLWRVGGGGLFRTLPGHAGWVNTVAFAPQGGLFASGDDRTILPWLPY